MAKSDYICCDICNCKVIYDGNWIARDNWETSGEWPTVICHDCAKKQGWKPIETAPKDGTPFLATYLWLGELRQLVADWSDKAKTWKWAGQSKCIAFPVELIHWKPLSTPPAKEVPSGEIAAKEGD